MATAVGRTWVIPKRVDGSLWMADVYPVLTNPNVSNVTIGGANANVTLSRTGGTLYYVVSTSSVAPSVAQIQAGLNNLGAAAYKSGNTPITNAGIKAIPLSGMSGTAPFYVFFTHNAGGFDSSVAAAAGFTLAGTAPTWSTPPAQVKSRSLAFPQYISNIHQYLSDPSALVSAIQVGGVNDPATIVYESATDSLKIAADPGYNVDDDIFLIAVTPTGNVNSASFNVKIITTFAIPDVRFTEGVAGSYDLTSAVTAGIPSGEVYTALSVFSGSLNSGVTGITLDTSGTNRRYVYDGVGTGIATGITLALDSTLVAADVTSFTLTSTAGGTLLPFTVGQAFKQGDVPSGQYLVSDIAEFQADVRNRWNDGPGGTPGSVKFAVLSGRKTLSPNVASAVSIKRSSTPSAGVNIAESSLNGKTCTVALGAYGTVSLASLIGSPVRSILGIQMSEFHYRSAVGSDAHLAVWFFVRSYLGGQVEIETCVENGYIGSTSGTGSSGAGADKSYVPTITINGTVRYNNSGASLTHWARSRWMTVNWYDGTSGLTDFARVTCAHDTTYFKSTKVVPNFATAPSATLLNNLTQDIAPLGQADIRTVWGSGGYASHIGVMPEWDAAYLVGGDVRAYRGVLTNSYACSTWQIGFRDENTQRPLRLTDRPGLNLTLGNQNGGFVAPATYTSSNPYPYTAGEVSHAPGEGYLAYLISGRWTHLETSAFLAQCSHMYMNPAQRGTNVPTLTNDATKGGLATDAGGQDRSKAWHFRTTMQTASIYPDTCPTTADQNVRTDWINALNATFPKMIAAGDTASPIGYIGRMYNPGLYGSTITNDLFVSGWQMSAIIQSMALASDIDTFLSTTARAALLTVRDHFYKYVVGILGDASGWNYRYYNTYTQVGGTYVGSAVTWAVSWAAAYTQALANPETGVTAVSAAEGQIVVANDNPFDPTNSQTIFPIGALAYAVDHGATGATDSWRRLSTCSQWSQYITSGAGVAPQWAITPRNPTTPSVPNTLRVSAANPRYFADSLGNVVYLAGSHTWNNFPDMDTTYPGDANPLNFTNYLNFLDTYNHNFFRLWCWEGPFPNNASLYAQRVWATPQPWLRTGPGNGTDGHLKYDLVQWNSAYFARLTARVSEAAARGKYCSVMLFEGWEQQFAPGADAHPFNSTSNINGVACGTPLTNVHTLNVSAITTLQDEYVRRVIDAVNAYDNVLYEICNEAGSYSTAWQAHMISLVKTYELTKPKQHPVGMTFQYSGGTDATLFASAADWISPGTSTYLSAPTVGTGSKVVINDNDHLGGSSTGDRPWVWKSFCRGLNVLFMDRYDTPDSITSGPIANGVAIRNAMGDTRVYAGRVDLKTAVPNGAITSTGYALSNSIQILVYAQSASSFTVALPAGTWQVEWYSTVTRAAPTTAASVSGGSTASFTSPLGAESILYLYK